MPNTLPVQRLPGIIMPLADGISAAQWTRCLLLAVCLLLATGHAAAWSTKATDATDLAFSRQSAVIDSVGETKLHVLVDRSNRSTPQVVIVIGHADSGEADAVALGMRRAKAAKFHFMQLGVSPNRIYIESKGNSQLFQPGPDARNRRVEIEYVGQLHVDEEIKGFSWMWLWMTEGGRLPVSIDDEWWAESPYSFLPKVEPELRERFLSQMQLVALQQKDDAALKSLRELGNAGPAANDALPSALYAQVYGTPYARAATRTEAEKIPAADPRRAQLAKRIWCSEKFVNRLEIVAELLPAPVILATLSEADQFSWVYCADTRPRDLLWLTTHGVRLDARLSDGTAALHFATARGKRAAVAALLDAGASPHVRNAAGETPLHIVARARFGSIPMLTYPVPIPLQRVLWELLLRAGAEPDALDKQGRRPQRPPTDDKPLVIPK